MGFKLRLVNTDEYRVVVDELEAIDRGNMDILNAMLSYCTSTLKNEGFLKWNGSSPWLVFTHVPTAEQLERLGLRMVEGPGPVRDPRIIAQRMFTSEGRPIPVNKLQSYILERIR